MKSANISSMFCGIRKQQAIGREQWTKHTSHPQEDILTREVTKDFNSYNTMCVLIHYNEPGVYVCVCGGELIKAQREYDEFISLKGFS